MFLNDYYNAVIRSVERIYRLYIRGLLTADEAKTATKKIGFEIYSDIKLNQAKLEILLMENIRESNKEKDSLIKDCIVKIYLNNVYGLPEEGGEIGALISYALYLATGKFFLTEEDLY